MNHRGSGDLFTGALAERLAMPAPLAPACTRRRSTTWWARRIFWRRDCVGGCGSPAREPPGRGRLRKENELLRWERNQLLRERKVTECFPDGPGRPKP